MAQIRRKKKTGKATRATAKKQNLPTSFSPPASEPARYVSPLLQPRLPALSWYEFVSTGFFSGYLPKAPGTWGSLVALLLFAVTAKWLPQEGMWRVGAIAVSWWALILGAVTIAVGIYASGLLAKEWREKDPSEVVIDEFAGIFLALSLVRPDVIGLGAALAFFRLFDVLKPGPIRSLQKLPGGYGIMLDDVLAGIAAAPCALIVQYLLQKML